MRLEEADVRVVVGAHGEGDGLVRAELLLEEVVLVVIGGVLGLAERVLVRAVLVAEFCAPAS